MNISQTIIKIFKEERVNEIVLVPNSGILYREKNKLLKFPSEKITAKDIYDTLVAFSHMCKSKIVLQKNGNFSIGIQNIGRIRIYYFKQRGSYFASIKFVPFDIPEIAEVFSNPIKFSDFVDELLKENGVYVISGENKKLNSLFVYSLLKFITKRYQKIIFILEENLSYLLNHNSSIVIQQELNEDIHSIEEGFSNLSIIDPHILYINVKNDSIFKTIPFLGENLPNKLIILNTDNYSGTFEFIPDGIIKVEETDDNKIRYNLKKVNKKEGILNEK